MEKLERVLDALEEHYGLEPRNWHTRQDVFEVLIGTVLSQRTKDENTDKAAQALFARYDNPKKLAEADVKSIEKLIRPSGFYKVKAKRIKEISKIILQKYRSKVPKKMEELLSLPGVGRKTAGCVLVYGFGIAESIPVDTHVHRISNRLGIVKTKTPEQTEKELMRIVPKKEWININQLLVVHGQNICRPISPKCNVCPVNKYCSYYKNVYLVEK